MFVENLALSGRQNADATTSNTFFNNQPKKQTQWHK
jgi:hypothetical protein